MSFDALAWAGKCQPGSAPRKLVLLALADRHNTETNVCFPSIDWLSDWTGLNRKTIINALQDLETAGFIADTKQRKGKTGQVKVYSLTLTKAAFDIVENHYVYRLESDNGEFYIGVRSYVGDIGSDRYTGSGTWPDAMRRAGVVIHKTIVSNHTTRTDAEIAEAMAIKSEINNPLCMNIEYKSTNRSVPKSGPLKSTVFSVKQSQKRDTEPVMEPPLNKPNGLSSVKPAKIDDSSLQPAHVVEAWNAMATRLGKPAVRQLTPQRRQLVKARIAQHQLDDFHAVFGKLEASPFLRGDGNWKKGATFDWLMKQGNFLKVLEGNYD